MTPEEQEVVRRSADQALLKEAIEHNLTQIEAALNAELWHVALLSSLTLPDVCAALEQDDGESLGRHYASWFDQWRDRSYVGMLDGFDVYRYRSRLLHQSRATLGIRVGRRYWRIGYVARGTASWRPELHLRVFRDHGSLQSKVLDPKKICLLKPPDLVEPIVPAPEVLLLDVEIFCRDMISSVRHWLPEGAKNPNVLRHALTMIRFCEGGIAGVVPFPMYT
jgi:hypothetical protein